MRYVRFATLFKSVSVASFCLIAMCGSGESQARQTAPKRQGATTYSPWARFCMTGEKSACFTGIDALTYDGMPAAAITLIEPSGEEKKILRITVPNSVSLQFGTRIKIDNAQLSKAPYVNCSSNGCVADYPATAGLIEQLKTGHTLNLEFALNGQLIADAIPLRGFAKAYEGPPTDLKVFEAREKKLRADLARRAAAAPPVGVSANQNPVSRQQTLGRILCTHGDGDYFWDTITIAPSELEQFSDRSRTMHFLDQVRVAGKEHCAQERARGRTLGQGRTEIGIPMVSAYPRNVQIEVYSGNERQVFATGDLDGPWERIESLPEAKRLAAEKAERERQAGLEAETVSERARKQFASGTGDPISGVWSSGKITLTIHKEGELYLVRVEGNGMGGNGEFAGPYKNSQIEIGGLVGNISVLPSSAQLIFEGNRFSKIRD